MSKNSTLLLVAFMLLSTISMASISSMLYMNWRRIRVFCSTSGASSSSSRRVPLRLRLMAGNTRFSYSRRSRWISQLPVPLNSSKITSSIRLPVSTRAVAMMVRLPPSSTLRAAPKKRFGRCRALASTPPVSTLPEEGTTLL